mgnify:CR=1 FL=1
MNAKKVLSDTNNFLPKKNRYFYAIKEAIEFALTE